MFTSKSWGPFEFTRRSSSKASLVVVSLVFLLFVCVGFGGFVCVLFSFVGVFVLFPSPFSGRWAFPHAAPRMAQGLLPCLYPTLLSQTRPLPTEPQCSHLFTLFGFKEQDTEAGSQHGAWKNQQSHKKASIVCNHFTYRVSLKTERLWETSWHRCLVGWMSSQDRPVCSSLIPELFLSLTKLCILFYLFTLLFFISLQEKQEGLWGLSPINSVDSLKSFTYFSKKFVMNSFSANLTSSEDAHECHNRGGILSLHRSVFFGSPVLFCDGLESGWAEVEEKVLSGGCVLTPLLPPAPRDHSPEPSEVSPKADGTVTSPGRSPRCWEGTNRLFALPGQCPRVTSCGCVSLPCRLRMSHLSLLFPPLFVCRLHTDTELESLFIFSVLLLRNLTSHSGKICFLPRRCCSSAPVENHSQWSRSNQPALGWIPGVFYKRSMWMQVWESPELLLLFGWLRLIQKLLRSPGSKL